MKRPESKKERNLLKGAIRRVFSRSELRLEALLKHSINHQDSDRPRVTKWSWCGDCGVIEARYLMQVDHIQPVIAIDESLEDLTWEELIEDRMWCALDNLRPLCPSCHKEKTRKENNDRRAIKKLKGENQNNG